MALRKCQPRLVAIVGSSGSGKSWLARQLQSRLGKEVAVVSLDDFYLDRTHLPLARRASINFDHPRSMDWPAVEQALRRCKAGVTFRLPRYDFNTHTRRPELGWLRPKPLVLVDGLWLLRRRTLRRLFSLSIFIECPSALSLRRRIKRDEAERGRSETSVRTEFKRRVAPMCQRYVLPQKRWADVVVHSPLTAKRVEALVVKIERLRISP